MHNKQQNKTKKRNEILTPEINMAHPKKITIIIHSESFVFSFSQNQNLIFNGYRIQ